MIDKRYRRVADALARCPDLRDGAVVLVAGFGDAGVPVVLLEAISELGLRNLTIVSNNAGSGEQGLAKLLRSGSVSRIVCSFPRSAGSVAFEALYDAGRLDLEVVPQGTLAERIRAGGAGIPAFFTPT
ncbi:MAG: 3-oxoacid CoA-transferase subunit A, partial [Gammaproteobacteria bacterium]|nr:3-oxoacid CoA-transferase subunit A [Gammaproteobacteria bacterium]